MKTTNAEVHKIFKKFIGDRKDPKYDKKLGIRDIVKILDAKNNMIRQSIIKQS